MLPSDVAGCAAPTGVVYRHHWRLRFFARFVPVSVCLFLLSVQRPPLNIYYFITLVELFHYHFGVCISTSPQIWKVVAASCHHYNLYINWLLDVICIAYIF